MNIRKKLILILVILVVLPSAIISYISIDNQTEQITAAVNEHTSQIVKALDAELEASIDGAQTLLSVMADADLGKSMDAAQVNSTMQEIVKKEPLISQIYIMDKTGMQVYKTSGALGDRSDRGYFKEAIKGNTYYSDALISGSTGKPIVTLAMPIKRGSDVVGVLGASIDLEGMADMVSQIKIGEHGYAFIVERNGKIIAHKDAELVEEMADMSNLEPVQKALAGEEGNVVYEFEGDEKLSAYASFPRTGWGIVAQLPSDEAYAQIDAAKQAAMITIIVLILAAVGVSVLVANNFSKPINKLVENMTFAADGDFTKEIDKELLDRKDEFGTLATGLSNMLDSFKDALVRIQKSAETLNSSSLNLSNIVQENGKAMEQVATGVTQLASAASNDAMEAEKGGEFIKQVVEGSEEVAKNTEDLNSVVLGTVNRAKEGSELMEKTANVVDETATLANTVTEKMGNLEEAAKDIGNFVGSIINIAEQTNLLALNAAIEAARAGEQGKGFAVVADEIRKLAEESNSSADKITQLVSLIQDEVGSTVEIYSNTNSKLKEVVVSSEQVQDQIGKIVSDSNNALTAVEEISAVSEEQAASSMEVMTMMENILGSINDTASTTQEISASTEEQTASLEEMGSMAAELSNMAKELDDAVNQFKL